MMNNWACEACEKDFPECLDECPSCGAVDMMVSTFQQPARESMIDWSKPLLIRDISGPTYPVLCWAKLDQPIGEFTHIVAYQEGIRPCASLVEESGRGPFVCVEQQL